MSEARDAPQQKRNPHNTMWGKNIENKQYLKPPLFDLALIQL